MSLFQEIRGYINPAHATQPVVVSNLMHASVHEDFVDEATTKSNVVNIFVGAALMALAAILAIAFYITAKRDLLLFIAVFAGVAAFYGAGMVTMVAIQRAQYKEWAFKLLLGSSIIMTLIALLVAGISAVMYVRKTRANGSASSSSSSSSSGYEAPASRYEAPQRAPDYGRSADRGSFDADDMMPDRPVRDLD